MELELRDKVLIGVGLTTLLLNLTILPLIFTGAVPGAVDDKFETYPLDSICGEDGDCDTTEEGWETSSTNYDYFAWDLINLDEVLENQATPQYQ